jgi:hypothetical protein
VPAMRKFKQSDLRWSSDENKVGAQSHLGAYRSKTL